MIIRRYIDWSKPILHEAVSWLLGEAEDSNVDIAELGKFICVVPGQRAGRMLLAVLVEKCQSLGKRLNAPDIYTPSQMVDALLPNRHRRAATDCERVLAWMQALKRTSDEDRSALLPHPPELGSFREWHYLAKHLVALHQELNCQIHAFDDNKEDGLESNVFTKVAEAASLKQLEAESQRWASISKVYCEYKKLLSEVKLVDPIENRWDAIRAGDCRLDVRIVLLGVVDLNAMQRATIANAATDVDILIHAPQDHENMFDEFGCVDPTAWEDAILPIDDDRIVVVDRAADQAQAMLREIALLNGKYAAQQITVGLGDESLSQSFIQAGSWANVELRWARGELLERSAPMRLLQTVVSWLKEPRFAHLASMLRHCDLERWLVGISKNSDGATNSAIENWQTLLDDYFTQYLQEHFSGDWLGNARQQQQLKDVYDAVSALIAPLNDHSNRLLGNYCSSTLELLRKIYASDADNQDSHISESLIEACSLLRNVCRDISSSEQHLQESVDAATGLDFILAEASSQRVTPKPRRNEIEMLGWLELHFDPAPVLLVAGFNEGFVPDAVTADVFLPDILRKDLNIMHNARRYARDAYLLSAMLNSREQMKIVLGQRTSEGEPLTPSRLLMACEDSQLASRVKHLTLSKDKRIKHRPMGIRAPSEVSKFTVAELPDDLLIPSAMSVTWFRNYLQCPYRFALDRLARLRSKDDSATELDAMQFGTLAHEVLCSFGREESLIDCDDDMVIAAFLCDTLSTVAKQTYGSSLLPAVRVQLSRMRQRLKKFASVQSQLRNDGWRICKCEFDLPGQCALDIPDGKSMRIKGRIDRIDQNENTNAYRLIDYKTGDTAKNPVRAHKGKNCYGEDWIDVQLPLYGHLAGDCGFKGEIELAYINLPKDPTAVDLYNADWSATDLEEAIDTARRVVSDIRKHNFEINLNHLPHEDEFARICQTTTFASVDSDGETSDNG